MHLNSSKYQNTYKEQRDMLTFSVSSFSCQSKKNTAGLVFFYVNNIRANQPVGILCPYVGGFKGPQSSFCVKMPPKVKPKVI